MKFDLKKFLILNFPYALMFWFFNRVGEGYHRARTTNNQNIFVDIVFRNLVPAHHDALCLRQENVLVKFWIYERAYIVRCAPTS